jgi:hypothetical protein
LQTCTVKIDVEGLETSIVRGLAPLLRKHKPCVFVIEHNEPFLDTGAAAIDNQEIFDILESDNGYRFIHVGTYDYVLARPECLAAED